MHFKILVTCSQFDQIKDQVLVSFFLPPLSKLASIAERLKPLLFAIIQKSQHIVSDYAVLVCHVS